MGASRPSSATNLIHPGRWQDRALGAVAASSIPTRALIEAHVERAHGGGYLRHQTLTNGTEQRAAESNVGRIAGFPYTAPYEEITITR